jgi:hypothetical protein
MLHQASQEAGCTPSIVGGTITRDCAGEKLSSSMTISLSQTATRTKPGCLWRKFGKFLSRRPGARPNPLIKTTDRDAQSIKHYCGCHRYLFYVGVMFVEEHFLFY